ncbi:MAG: hypothetical protein IJ809_01880 [Clostridia bacterium]|nr:hypothetical protein [Clostridia bacterium]
MAKNEKIKKAEEEMQYLTGGEEVRRRAELRERYLKELSTAQATGEDIGKIETEIKTIISMYKDGLEVSRIARIMSKTEDEINRIIQENTK